MARFVNDQDCKNKPNCKIRMVIVDGIPRLGIFTLKDIGKGTELRYDYGCRDVPWRKFKVFIKLLLWPTVCLFWHGI